VTEPRPLEGVLVLDATRMLPGAVLARLLMDLGARLIKVEDPLHGEPMRHTPPMVDGVGCGFAVFYGGAESICLDLRTPGDTARLLRLAKRADVLVESFRPGTMDRWGLGYEALAAKSPGLVYCSLSGFGAEGPQAARVGHDMNFQALSGVLAQLPAGLPRIQLADVTSAVLASTSITAALLRRARTGRGARLDQPLMLGPLAFLQWAFAEASLGGGGAYDGLLAGALPGYRIYQCADGARVVLGAIEPKFWEEWVALMELPELRGKGLHAGAEGDEVAGRLAERFRERPASHWLELAGNANLPLTRVNGLEEAMAEPCYAGRLRTVDVAGRVRAPATLLPSFGTAERRPAPALGADTQRVLAELGG
jgi:crotonobetainyl-CoA:carnitine CoA-transferase CaiB-like acyl-CoA transferase